MKKIFNIAVGIVLYHPTKKQLDLTLDYVRVFKNVLVYLNSPIKKKLSNHKIFSNKFIHIDGNKINNGLSKAYNDFLERCIKKNIKFLLILDQDSIFPFYINSSFSFLNYKYFPKDAALISLKIVPKNYSIYNQEEYSDSENKVNFIETQFAINSGSIIDVIKIKELGGYDQTFFVDRVDKDICKKIEKSKYKIYKPSKGFIFHNVGKPLIKKILNHNFKINIHEPYRIYSISLSRVKYNKKWIIYNSKDFLLLKLISFLIISILQVLKHLFYILLSQNKIIESTKNLLKGSFDGLF